MRIVQHCMPLLLSKRAGCAHCLASVVALCTAQDGLGPGAGQPERRKRGLVLLVPRIPEVPSTTALASVQAQAAALRRGTADKHANHVHNSVLFFLYMYILLSHAERWPFCCEKL